MTPEPEPDYAALGFMAGLEIHQQLDTRKLFCRCRSHLDEPVHVEAHRTLRPTTSELGEVDPAMLAEARKKLAFHYEAGHDSACLVDLDEEPPHSLTPEAVEVALTVAELFNMRPSDEVHVMRKIVIDGSNTSGFQRTALLASGGAVEAASGPVALQAISLEEDSARKVEATKEEKAAGLVRYRLDRLGIPLVEIATNPGITGPDHAREVAEAIGMVLRSTGSVKRGLGTIRQDLNISIREGARIEVKGVQTLDIIPEAVRYEVRRQLKLLEIRAALAERGIAAADLRGEQVDVTALLADCGSKILQGTFKRGGKAVAVALPGFHGLIGRKDPAAAATAPPVPRFGRELADHAKVAAGVGGIFHTDELPAYGITDDHVARIRDTLGLGDGDAFVLVAAPPAKAARALEAVVDRARVAFECVPEETREVQEDGASAYLRPLPGGARMYPETDVPPFRVTAADRERIRANLPELIPEKIERLQKEHGIAAGQARLLARSGRADVYEAIVRETGLTKEAARALTDTFAELSREGVAMDSLDDAAFLAVFRALAAKDFAKEAVADVLRHLATKPGSDVEGAVDALGLKSLGEAEVVAIVDRHIAKQADYVKEKGGMAAMGGIMGPIMGELRGKADGGTVNRVVKERLAAFLAENG